MITAFVNSAQVDLDEHLDELCFDYNTATHAATGMMPMDKQILMTPKEF